MQMRLAVLVTLTAVLAVIAVSALVAPTPDVRDAGTPTPAAGAAPAATPTPAPPDLNPSPGEPFVLSAESDGQIVSLTRGREALIEVHAREPASVQLGDHGPVEAAEPGTPATFAVFGDESFEQPIRLVESGREIGRVQLAGGG